MSADVVGLGFAVHGVLCPAAFLAVWKLHGDSKFGKQPQEEIRELRGRLLRSIAQSLVEVFEPILTYDTSVEISKLLHADGSPVNTSPKITTIGKEAMRDAVRDFVKSDVETLKSLRTLDASNARITYSLIWLRRLTLTLAVASGGFALFAALSKFEVWRIESTWPHAVALFVSVSIVSTTVMFTWLIMHSVNNFERLKDKYDDLS